MTIVERVSYLKGLADGLGLDENAKQDKLIKSIIEVLGDMSDKIAKMDGGLEELSDQLDAVDDDLAKLEESYYGDDACGCGDDEFYEVVCPNCGEEVCLDAAMLEKESIECPNCGTELEFDFDCDCDDDGCGCEGCKSEE